MVEPVLGNTVIVEKSVISTNDFCHTLIGKQQVEEGLTVMAMYQTGGRGTGLNKWESQNGKNLLFSIILMPHWLEPADQFSISMAVSLGVADFVNMFSKNVFVKWPNDIYADEKKIAGILIESSIMENRISETIAGIGVNINQTRFGKKAPNAVSLKQITKTTHNLHNLLKLICQTINTRYVDLKENGKEKTVKSYLNKLYKLNTDQTFRSKGEVFSGTITGIDKYGRLAVKSNSTTNYYGFKEIELIQP